MTRSSTVDKALDLLFHLHEGGRPLGASELGRALGVPKSNAYRLARALADRGVLERDERGRYRPGFALVALGAGVLQADPVAGAARPDLEREARALGETVFLTAARAGRIAVLDKVEGTGFLRAAPQVGSSVPVHATAVGKLQLAFAPEEIEAPTTFEAFTERTAADPVRLAAEVERARAAGWAANVEEWIPGLSVVAVPVQVGGRMVAALAVATASPRLRELGVVEVALRLRAASERIAAKLRGQHPRRASA